MYLNSTKYLTILCQKKVDISKLFSYKTMMNPIFLLDITILNINQVYP